MPAAGRARATPSFHIERLTSPDSDGLDALMEIERASFPTPWGRGVFAEELTRAAAFIDVLRAPESGRVVAFCNYWRVADEVHVLKIATHPDERRKGWGACLLGHMIDFARRLDSRLITLEVRRSNVGAQGLYRRFGFKAVGLRPGYYGSDGDDALIMTLMLHEGGA